MNTDRPLLDKADADASRPRSSSAPARGGPPPAPPRATVGPAATPPPGDDARVHLFRRWCRAVDSNDLGAARFAVRELRKLGVSVCPTGTGGRP